MIKIEKKNKKVIIFDLDGTLIDSVPDLTRSLNEMLEQFSGVKYDDSTVHSWLGNGAQTLVKRALLGKVDVEEESIDSSLFEAALALFLKRYSANVCEDTRLYPHVVESLEKLSDKGYKMAIVTNKPIAFVSPILEKLEIASYFEALLGGDSLSKKKPDPAPLLYICEKFSITPQEAVMVGDSKNDIEAAKHAKMDSIAVSYGYNYGENIENYMPNVVISDFKEIVEYL